MTASEKRICPVFNDTPRRFHLLGVCGTGMGALAVLLRESGYAVSGSDTGFYPPMSDILERYHITTSVGWGAEQLDALDPAQDIVVVGNVCRKTNEASQAALERGFTCLSLPETLYHFFLKTHKDRIVVTGTHGKTTTSAITQAIFLETQSEASFFIGGEVAAYGSGAHIGAGERFIVEGDEYDSAWFDKVPKFWHYAATLLGINNIEFDHADIYANLDEIIAVFEKGVADMPPNTAICYNADDPIVCDVIKKCARARSFAFSTKSQGDFNARDIENSSEGTRFVLDIPAEFGTSPIVIQSSLSGLHNVYNATAAASFALISGATPSEVVRGIAAFGGVKRRQQRIDEVDGILIYDDFAHHPTAVRETVRAIRLRHPNAKLWGIFEMKSNTSRRAIFQNDYPVALSECDAVILSAPWKKDDLPPEQLIDIPKVAHDLNATNTPSLLIPDVDDIVAHLSRECRPGDVVLGMSGANFGNLHRKLAAELAKRNK